MNNFKKIGLSALAGSLAAITSANAVEMSASGSAKLTYINGDQTEVTGNPYGMNTSLAFSGSGDVNGYDTTLTVVASDQVAGMSSAALAIDLGDMGKVTFDQGTGAGGISTIDDKTPSANEEVWDGLDAITGDSNGLVGGGNSGVFVYSNTIMDSSFSLQYSKGSANNSDDTTSGEGVTGSSWDFALTNANLADGLNVGVGYGKIANAAGSQIQSGDTDVHQTVFATYAAGMVTVGAQLSEREDNTKNGTDEEAQGWGVAINLMDGLSVSYGEREIEHQKASANNVTEDQEGFALAYTMGSAKITFQQNEVSNNGGTTGTNDEATQVALSLSF